MGLSGVGDTFGTCFGPLSRNRGTGLRLGRGERLDDILADLGEVADCVEIDQWKGRVRQNVKPLDLGHIAVDSADFRTKRSLSSRSRSAAEERASRPSHTRPLKSGRRFEFRAGADVDGDGLPPVLGPLEGHGPPRPRAACTRLLSVRARVAPRRRQRPPCQRDRLADGGSAYHHACSDRRRAPAGVDLGDGKRRFRSRTCRRR